jgi:hypothetical protein
MNAFKCPKCGELTGGNEKFCIECGQPLNVKCPECGESWRFMFEYKFCPGCGHNMKESATNLPPQEVQVMKRKIKKSEAKK